MLFSNEVHTAQTLNKSGIRAVILAGGRGTRLAPYTAIFPKPLMPLGNTPILELLIKQLNNHGIKRITLATGYLAYLIVGYFGNGSEHGVTINYSSESEPLGTAGPIAQVQGLDETFIVINGDLLTDLDFRAMIAEHFRRKAIATIGIYQREVNIDLGVIQIDPELNVTGYLEKPTSHYHVSMGVYVFEPAVVQSIPRGCRFDLPDLINALLKAGKPVVGYLHQGYWLDIGRQEDYNRAQEDYRNLSELLLSSGKNR